MALIRSLGPGGTGGPHLTEVDCLYVVLTGNDGGKTLHLTTYGSDHRQDRHTGSQVLDISPQIAQELVDLFRTVFPSVR